MHSQALLFKLVFLGFFSLFLSACGGSSETPTPTPIVDTTPPTIEFVYPDEDASEDFEVDLKAEITFSELMNIDSLVYGGGLKIFSGSTELDAVEELEERFYMLNYSIVPLDAVSPINGKDIQVPATKVSLTHASGRFALNTNYTVIVDKPAHDLVEDDLDTPEDERNFVVSATRFGFRTERGAWKAEKTIPSKSVEDNAPVTRSFNRLKPKLISNRRGDTFIFWIEQGVSNLNTLWVSRYLPNTREWTLPDFQLICDSASCANSYQLSINDGNAVLEYDAKINQLGQLVIAWTERDASTGFSFIQSRIYNGSTWLEPTDISSTGLDRTGNADSPQIAIDKKGNVVAVWREKENNNANSRLKSNIYRVPLDQNINNGNWTGAPEYISSSVQSEVRSPQLALSKDGLGIVVWSEKESNFFNIMTNHIRLPVDPDSPLSWFGATTLDVTNLEVEGNSSSPKIAVDHKNDAFAVWLKHDGQRNNLWYSRFVGSWENAGYVERDRTGDAGYPAISFSEDNRALVSWTQDNPVTKNRKLITRLYTLEGWGLENTIASSIDIAKPASQFDFEGNAFITWQQGLTGGKINASYYSELDDTWSEPETIGTQGKDVSIASLFEDGRFIAAWESEDSSKYTLKSAIYSD